VWQPDVCRPLAALGPDPLSWSSGTLATKQFYLPLFRRTNEGEPYLVIRFTNALLFYFKVSTLDLFTPVRSSLALKATEPVVAIGDRPALHRRDNLPIMVFAAGFAQHERPQMIEGTAKSGAQGDDIGTKNGTV
jgi:hypothetical protein